MTNPKARTTKGIVLAGGRSLRMGSPKALLRLDGDKSPPLAITQSELLLEGGCTRVVIVLGAGGEEIEKELSPLPDRVAVVQNKQWEKGQFSSIQVGLRNLSADATGWTIVLPVDVTGLKIGTVKALVKKINENYDAVIPVFQDRRGHPVLISPLLVKKIIALDPARSRLDRLLARSNSLFLPVNDGSVLNNLNRPGRPVEQIDAPSGEDNLKTIDM